jgi:hypothetical protein
MEMAALLLKARQRKLRQQLLQGKQSHEKLLNLL